MCTLRKVRLLIQQGEGGTMIVVAPRHQLEMLEGHNADDHMEKRLGCDYGHTRVHHSRFAKELQTARTHTASDRDAMGRTLDGAFVISAEDGVVRRAGILFKGLNSEVSWPDHGSRHSSAFGVARSMKCGVVFVASDAGKVHAITAEGARKCVAHLLK